MNTEEIRQAEKRAVVMLDFSVVWHCYHCGKNYFDENTSKECGTPWTHKMYFKRAVW